MKLLLGQIVALTKFIRLHPKNPDDPAWTQFIAGKRRAGGHVGGIGLCWWADEGIFEALESVANLILSGNPGFAGCDNETVQSVVVSTLQELCLDNNLFSSEDVIIRRRQTLFDCRRQDVPKFADALLQSVKANLQREISRHCTIYLVPRFIVTSFDFDQGSLHVVAKDDRVAWQQLIDRGYVFDGWSPSAPQVYGRTDKAFSPIVRTDCALITEEVGSRDGALRNSVLRFRQLLALMYAVVSERSRFPIHRSMADPSDFCMQFSHKDCAEKILRRPGFQPLVPFYAEDVEVNASDQLQVVSWYESVAKLSGESRGRAEKGAHFFNRGMNANDIESFINYFISLDAIFGERGSVEASILRGVRSLKLGGQAEEKTRWLFELRSELVHGASRYPAEWPKYSRYRNHFRSEPAADVNRVARAAVLRAPSVLGAQQVLGQPSSRFLLNVWAQSLLRRIRFKGRRGR